MERPICECGKRPVLMPYLGSFVCGECFLECERRIATKNKKILDEVQHDSKNSNN